MFFGIFFKDLEVLVELLVKSHNRGDVTAAVTVVWCRPDGDDFLVKLILVALLDELMCATNKVKLVDSVEFGSDAVAEKPTSAARRYCPCSNIFRVGPHEVAECSLRGDFLASVNGSDLIQGANVRGQAAMNAKNDAVYEGGDGEIIKDLTAVLPGVGSSILSLTLIVKAVDLCDLARLVVSA